VITAESGMEGLKKLEAGLEHVRERWPETLRLLLTGYADIHFFLAAIKRGEIYRHIIGTTTTSC